MPRQSKLGKKRKLARGGLAVAHRRKVVDRERPEVGQRHLALHQQRSNLLGVADAHKPDNSRP